MKKTTLKAIVAGFALVGAFAVNAQQTPLVKSIQTAPVQNIPSQPLELTDATLQNIAETGYARCITDEVEKQLQSKFPNRAREQQFEEWLEPHIEKIKADRAAGRAPQAVYNIPVVIHIVHNGDAVNTIGTINGENISDAQAISQIDVMNEDYRRMAATPGGANTTGLAVDVEINFCLAQQDAAGVATSGVVRHNITPYSNNVADGAGGVDWETNADVQTMKAATQWDPTKYINFWSIRPGGLALASGGLNGLLGYAQFPDRSTTGLGDLAASGGAANTDGVVAGFDAFGTLAADDGSFTLNPTYNLGRTMTHEVGHWLGLRHIWGDTAGCAGGAGAGDYCADTPDSNTANYTCVVVDNCPTDGLGNDMVQNYMDYTNDACMDTFTQNQKDRMQAVMANSPRRMELNSSIGCQTPTPVLSFAAMNSSSLEIDDCTATDVIVTVDIGKAPSANADVIITTAGAATDNLDYQIIGGNLSFLAGQITSKTFTVRIFNDGFVETDETIVLGMNLNANGGDATITTALDKEYVLTITNDDVVPVNVQNTVLQTVDFETDPGLGIIDADGDGQNFTFITGAFGGVAGRWIGSVVDESIFGNPATAYTPDNYLILPQINIPADATNVEFQFEVGTNAGGGENYSVYFATDTNSTVTIQAGTVLESRTSIGGGTETRTINSAAIAGQTGSFVVRHHNQISNTLLVFDTVQITATVTTAVQTANNSATPVQNILTDAGTIYTSVFASGNVMADITNTNGVDYGCVDTSVSRATGASVMYQVAGAANYVMGKTFTITPASVQAGGNATVKFYFTEAEVAEWEGATGNNRSTLAIIKDNGVSETAVATIGAFGSNVTLEATFSSGINGTYYFGKMESVLGVAENQFNLFNVSPVPSNGDITLFLSTNKNVNVKLYDIRGRKVYSELHNNNSDIFVTKLDFSTMASGVYMLHVKSGTKQAIRKIVIR